VTDRYLMPALPEIREFVSDKARELLERPPVDAWAACASIWSRIFILSGPGWARDAELFETMRTAFSVAMQRSTGVGEPPSTEQILSAFEAFGLETMDPPSGITCLT
jgi:hypothetical protein